MNTITADQYTTALDFLANYTGDSKQLMALDAKLADGGSLTNEEVTYVCGLARWWNMDKGN
jgi:hypothetical protein